MSRIEKKYKVNTSAEAFLEALTNQTMVSQWSGAPAIMGRDEGQSFSLWGDSIVGYNVEVSDTKLIQSWKENQWAGYSRVIFSWTELEKGIAVTLLHEDIPPESYDNLVRGWDDHYMNPLITWLESNNL
ncbi:MAG: SRPBCC domain-containing protein [Reichenbachiella sp.]|uniref:SRPBCC domain-containing protein n=1 Tax=Reichenbachiella sp. TaxID=2184521 RepID=UPI00326709A2